MNFKRALNKEQTTCINGIFVLFVFLSHFGQYETMPWNNLLLAIGQLMVAPFLFYSGYGIMYLLGFVILIKKGLFLCSYCILIYGFKFHWK